MDDLTEMMADMNTHCYRGEIEKLIHVYKTASELLYFGNAYGETPSPEAVQWMRDIFVRWHRDIYLPESPQRRLLDIARITDIREFLHSAVVFCEYIISLLGDSSTND